MERLAIVMPVYNEEEAIGAVLDKWVAAMDRLGIEYQIHPYNDGSKDNSWGVIRAKAEEHAGKVVAHTKPNGGHGPTILQGYREAAEAGYDWVFQIDSDDEMGPERFSELWRNREKYDFLVGIRDGRKQALPRKIISAVSRLSVRLFFGKSIWDVNTPYRLMRVSAFKDVWNMIPKDTFAPNVIISGMAARKKMRYYETRVPQRDRQTGEVSIKKWKLFKAASRSFVQTMAFSFTSMVIAQSGYGHVEPNKMGPHKNTIWFQLYHKINLGLRRTLCFINHNRSFLILMLTFWMLISGYILLNLPQVEISVVFSNTTPSSKCVVKTAPCTWRFTSGQCAYKTSFCSSGQKCLGTPWSIRDLWIIPSEKGKAVEVESIFINGEKISASYLKKNAVNGTFSAEKDFIAITKNTRFKIDNLSWNSSLNKKIIAVLTISLFCALAASFFCKWFYKKFSGTSIWANFVPSALAVAIVLYMLYKVITYCWQLNFICIADTLVNLNAVMHYICLEKWNFDPFITAGLAYLYPLSLIISCCSDFSSENLMHSIVLWNFILFLFPCIVILLDSRWKLIEKLFLSACLIFAFTIIPNPYLNIGSLNSLYGELAASCVFIAAVIAFFRGRNLYSLALSGFLFAISTQIKQVFVIHTIIAIGCVIISGEFLYLVKKKFFRGIFAWAIGFAIPKTAGVIFEITSFQSLAAYKQYLNNCNIYNYEGAIQIHLWDKEFLINMWSSNWQLFFQRFNVVFGVAICLCGIWAIYRIATAKRYDDKYREQLLPIVLLASSFGYLIFWLFTSSVSWRLRHLNGVHFVFMAGLIFLVFVWIRRHMTSWSYTTFICVILIFSLLPLKKSHFKSKDEIASSHTAIYPILKQYHQQNALIFVDELPQIYLRGRHENLRMSANLKMIDGTKVIVWCRKKQMNSAPKILNIFKKTELYNDNTFIVERFDPPEKMTVCGKNILRIKKIDASKSTTLTEDASCFFISGTRCELLAKDYIAVPKHNQIQLVVRIKNTGDTPANVYIGHRIYDKNFRPVGRENYPYNGVNHVFRILSGKAGQKSLKVDVIPPVAKNCLIALGAKEDLSDIPNFNLIDGEIAQIKQLADGHAEIIMTRALKKDIPSGTAARVNEGKNLFTATGKIIQPGKTETFKLFAAQNGHCDFSLPVNIPDDGCYFKPFIRSTPLGPPKKHSLKVINWEITY